MAERDAVLFISSDTRLRKKVLAENTTFDDMITLGYAYEHNNMKSKQIESRKYEKMLVRRMVQEEVNQLNQRATGGQGTKTQCQTCSREHGSEFDFPGKSCQNCYDCGESHHFKGASSCKEH